MEKILLTLLAVLTLSSLSAQNKGTNQMRVLWVEIEESNTSAQITGTNAGNTYAGYTCGDWTHNNTVPFPMADDRNALNTCAGLYEGSVPTVFFIAPNGYYRSIYGEADGISHFDTAICNSHMVDLMNNYPRSGQAPVISGISIPGAAAANANVTFKVEYISVDAATVEWTFQDGNPATASTATATCSWSTPGTYTVTVTVTNANGSASETGTISILNYISLFDFESNGFNAWTTVDADGDGENWGTRSGGHESSTCITSASWTQAAGPLTPNNWAFSPAITLPNESGLTLTWWDQGQDPDYAAEHYAVYICTEATVASASATTPVWEGNSTDAWRNLTASLDAYAGQTIYIAFRHYNVTDQFMLNIDDVGVASGSPAKGITTPKGGAKAQWAHIGNPFTTYDFRDTQHQYPISLQAWLDSGYCVVVDYSCTWCGPCWNLHTKGILDGFFYRFGPNFSYPFVGLDNAEEINLNVYPNPTTGIVTVDGEGIKNVEVMDMSGRMVMNTNDRTVDMTNLSNGIYMMRISTEKGTFTQKIVKK